jgi:hypothetical protein
MRFAEMWQTAYQDFFATWKDADPEIPVLKQGESGIRKAAVNVGAPVSRL